MCLWINMFVPAVQSNISAYIVVTVPHNIEPILCIKKVTNIEQNIEPIFKKKV